MTYHISLWMTDGCMASSLFTLSDAFGIANLWHRHMTGEDADPLFAPHMVSTDGRPVTVQGNVRIETEMDIGQIDTTDCVIVPPILPNLDTETEDPDRISSWLKCMRRQDAIIASVCTGSFILARLGLLDGKKATTNWQFATLFKARFPKVALLAEDILVEDDRIISTGAATAVNNLAVHLIRRFGSRKLAAVCAKAMLVDTNRLTQSPYTLSIPFHSHGDSQVFKAQTVIKNEFATIESIDEIAGRVGISPRHFKRRFKKATGDLPLKYLQKIRIDAAKELLESTGRSLDEITLDVGYKDVSSFCRLFRQHTQISPKAYREKFFRCFS